MHPRSSFGERDIKRPKIVLEIGPALCPGDRHDIITLRQHPGECELRGGAALVGSDGLDLADERKVPGERIALKARSVAAVIVRRQVFVSRIVKGV